MRLSVHLCVCKCCVVQSISGTLCFRPWRMIQRSRCQRRTSWPSWMTTSSWSFAIKAQMSGAKATELTELFSVKVQRLTPWTTQHVMEECGDRASWFSNLRLGAPTYIWRHCRTCTKSVQHLRTTISQDGSHHPSKTLRRTPGAESLKKT